MSEKQKIKRGKTPAIPYEPGLMLKNVLKSLEGVKTAAQREIDRPILLTTDEAATACHLWAALTTGDVAAREQLDAAPENIRAAIAAASKVALESGGEPKGSPFEAPTQTHSNTP